MSIDVTVLTTVEQCDHALEDLNADKTLLERRRRNLDERLTDRLAASTDISQDIAATQAVMAGYQAALAVITDEREIRNFELKVEREETRLKSLQNRQANYDSVAIFDDQIKLARYDAEIGVIDTNIAAVTAHRATL